MRTTSYRSISFLILLSVMAVFISFSSLKAANIVSSLDFQISPSAQTAKLGDYILMNMAVIDATTTYSNVIVTAVTGTSIEVYSPDFPAGFPGAIYVYDGSHTWLITSSYTNATLKSLVLTNANMIAGQTVSSYYTMQYADFNASEGTLAAGGSATVDIGTAISGIPLYDDGVMATHNDAGFNDGIYNCKFLVRESYKFNIQNGTITGRFVKSGIQASNAPFAAPSTIRIDGVRPKISLVNANPNPYNPNKELEQFYYSLSEVSTVTLTILQGATVVKTLAATGNYGFNQPILWDGLDDNGVLQGDGDYIYRFDMTDSVGNTGASFAGVLKLTTVDLTTTLYSVDTSYIQTSQNEVMVTLNMYAELNNATTANMQNLGFDYPEAGITHDYKNFPYLYIDVRLYDAAGNMIQATSKDHHVLQDWDPFYIDEKAPTFADGWSMVSHDGYELHPRPINNCAVSTTEIYTEPDGQLGNDWDNVFWNKFTDMGGGRFVANPVYVYYEENMPPGTYIAAFKGILVGKTIVFTSVATEQGQVDCVVGTTTTNITYNYKAVHAMPSYFYDSTKSVVGDERGYGLSSEDNTVSFIVEQNPTVPTADVTPPVIINLSAIPSNNEIVEPGEISPTNYIQIGIRDDGVGAGPINLSIISLLDPRGNPVPGHIAWNGGVPGTKNWSLYYIPDSPIVIGGVYTYVVTPIDAANNRGTTVTYTFTVADTAIPVVQSARVQNGSGSTLELSKSLATQVTFLVSKIEATVNPGGTADVNWSASSISVSGVAGVSSHVNGTNTLVFTPTSVMADGQYVVAITAVSDNGYTGITTYTFYITTAAVTYVNLSGSGDNSNTCLRISSFTTAQSGVSDGSPVDIPPAELNKITVATFASPPAAPSGYTIIGNAIAFSLAAPYVFPLNFNTTLCASNLRMHFTDAHLSTLTSNGLTTSDLSLWVYESTWTRINTAGTFITNGTDHYFEVPVTGIPAGNRYALMYQPPVIPPDVYKFENDKAFNPSTGPAKVYYTDDISNITSMKVYIYNISGTLIRTMDFNDSADNPLFISNDVDPANSSNFKYYIAWDGKNDTGALVRNGIYIFKYKITRTSGPAVTKTRMIAVVK